MSRTIISIYSSRFIQLMQINIFLVFNFFSRYCVHGISLQVNGPAHEEPINMREAHLRVFSCHSHQSTQIRIIARNSMRCSTLPTEVPQ